MECFDTNKEFHQLSSMPERIPIDGTFELTIRCNLHCKMCLFRHDDNENTEIMKNELTTEQWIQLAKEVSKAGTISLLLTGGEPMLRKDFCELYEGIYKQGFLLTLYTNATMVTPEIMETLRKYPPHRIGVTIYGASPETYQKVCGQKEAFNKMLEGIRELKKLPSIMEYRTTIIKDNYDDIDGIEEFVHKESSEDTKLIQTRIVTKAVRGACADVDSCRLNPEDNIRLAFRRGINIIKDYIGDKYDENNLVIEYIDRDNERTGKQKLSLFGCNAGMSSYTISWDGQLLGCQMLGYFHLDTKEIGFQKSWEEFPTIVKLPPIDPKCQSCKSQQICNCCYASRYAETGSLGGVPDYVCQDTAIMQSLINKGGKN